MAGVSLNAGEEVYSRFALPESGEMLDIAGTVVWTTVDSCGVRFCHVADSERAALQQCLTACVERSVSKICERVRAACA